MFIGICSTSQVSVYRTIGPLVFITRSRSRDRSSRDRDSRRSRRRSDSDRKRKDSERDKDRSRSRSAEKNGTDDRSVESHNIQCKCIITNNRSAADSVFIAKMGIFTLVMDLIYDHENAWFSKMFT